MFQVIEFFAVVIAAVYGIWQARAAKMDILGVFTVASVVAFGGGTLRDLFLDRHPLFWIANPHYPMIVLGMSIVTCLFRKMPSGYKRYLDVPDAIGMGLNLDIRYVFFGALRKYDGRLEVRRPADGGTRIRIMLRPALT